MNELPLQIAIDGPVASGKGEIAARLATKLQLLYIYTGAMYRALALACLESGVSFKDENRVVETLNSIRLEMKEPDPDSGFPYKILLNDTDVTERITQQDTAQGASDVGTLPSVRQRMVILQRDMAKGKRVVMEGRDIGLRVLPDAQLKIFLTATLEERANRRYQQWKKQGLSKTLEDTLEDTRVRDTQDSTRGIDPLQKVPDAWVLDTTSMTPDEVVRDIMSELSRRNLI